MKKLVLFAALGLFLLGFAACGGQYADAKETMQESIDLMNNFSDAMEKADDGKAVAAALEDYIDGMKSMTAKMEELSKKYPELNDKDKTPEELKDLMAKGEEASQRMSGAMMKIIQYASDPEVAKLMPKLQEMR